MSTQTKPDFLHLSNILTLAAFAAEARRVLSDIETMSHAVPEFEEQMSTLIDARRQWTLYDDRLPEVVNAVARQLEELGAADS